MIDEYFNTVLEEGDHSDVMGAAVSLSDGVIQAGMPLICCIGIGD